MRRYLLDTTPLAAYLLGRPVAHARIAPWIQQHEVTTSIFSYGEVVEYIRGKADYFRLYTQLRSLLRVIPPMGPTYTVMERYADLRRAMRPPRGPGLIGDIDTLVAATAFVRGLTLITADRDFQRVPGLNMQLLSFKS